LGILIVAGEKHLTSKHGIKYNFCGPGTNVKARLARGDPAVDVLDLLCRKHDIDHHLAKSLGDVKKADKRFLDKLQKIDVHPKTKELLTSELHSGRPGKAINLQDSLPPQMHDSQPSTNISGEGFFRSKGDPARKLKQKIKKYHKKYKTDKLLGIAFKSLKKRLHK